MRYCVTNAKKYGRVYCVGRIYLEVPYQLLKKCRLDSEKLPLLLDFVAKQVQGF